MDCQARDKWKLDFDFNASFTSLNVAKVTMKEMGMEYSMSSFKSLMTNIYLVKRIFKASGYTPNRTLISKIFKDRYLPFSDLSEKLSALSKRFLDRYSPAEPIAMFHSE